MVSNSQKYLIKVNMALSGVHWVCPVGVRLLIVLLLLHLVVPVSKGESDVDLQPVQFSHKSHVSEYEISCRFCHSYTDRSPKAGLPTQDSCLSCHQLIKGRTEEQKTEIAKIQSAWFLSDPIKWKRIYDLPDFVYFSHRSHESAGVECQNCHGAVEELEEIRLLKLPNDLSMGWCMSCHKYPFNSKTKTSVKEDIINNNSAANDYRYPGTDCLKCHQ